MDQEARLEVYGAQKTQYLEIMKRAVLVKETLEVSEKLSEYADKSSNSRLNSTRFRSE